MARFDRDQPKHTQHASAKPVKNIPPSPRPQAEKDIPDGWPYGRGARTAWSALALTLLLTTVSLLAHDSAQQTVAAAPVIAAIQPLPAKSSSATTSPRAIVTSGTQPEVDTEAMMTAPAPVSGNVPDSKSTAPPVATPDAAAATVLPVGGAAVTSFVNPAAAPAPSRQGPAGSGYQITPSALSTTPITLAATAPSTELQIFSRCSRKPMSGGRSMWDPRGCQGNARPVGFGMRARTRAWRRPRRLGRGRGRARRWWWWLGRCR